MVLETQHFGPWSFISCKTCNAHFCHKMMSITFFLLHKGAGIYVTGGVGRISNNSILETSSEGRIPRLLCLSGSDMSAVGQWIAPDGRDLTTIQNDPFDVLVGDSNNPGELIIETPVTNPALSAAHEGVYTCLVPNETGGSEYLRVGIYLRGSASE